MNAEDVFEKLFNHFNVSTIKELSEITNIGASTISNWKQRESINAIKKKCRELGIYKEIFEDSKKQENTNNSIIETKIDGDNNLSEYFTALQSVAIATNKEDELVLDIRELIKKYMQ